MAAWISWRQKAPSLPRWDSARVRVRTSGGEQVMHRWPQAVVGWAVVVFDKYVLCQQSITLLLLNKHPQLQKVKGTMIADHSLLFGSPRICSSFSDLSVQRLPEVCGSRGLSWVSGRRHPVWHHYGPTWCLHEVLHGWRANSFSRFFRELPMSLLWSLSEKIWCANYFKWNPLHWLFFLLQEQNMPF